MFQSHVLRLVTFAALSCFFAAGTLFGATFYVAVDGNDTTGTGSTTTPWATLQQAVSQVSDGDEIVVRDGVYRGQNLLERQFANGIVIRSENNYQARFVFTGPSIVGTDCQGMRFQGFVFQQETPFPQDNVVMMTGDTQRITFDNNIFHDAIRLSLLYFGPGGVDLTMTNNMFYNAGLASESNHIRVEGGRNVLISDNVFFNDYEGSGRGNTNNSGAFVFITNPTDVAGVDNIQIRRNIMFHWQGLDNISMIQLGSLSNADHYDAENVTVENNLMLGDGPLDSRAFLTLQNARSITIRNNTFSGDLPSLAFAFYMISSQPTILNDEITITNNIWNDPFGTMGARNNEGILDFCDCLPQFNDLVILANNLYYNGGNPMPFDQEELLNPVGDSSGTFEDPLLATPETITLPRYSGGSFLGGHATIREVFVAMADAYGRVGAGSPAINGAPLSPEDDLLGNLRGSTGDLGAMEFAVCSLAGDLNDDRAVNEGDFGVFRAAWTTTGVADLNNDGRVSVLDGVQLRNQIAACGEET
ncbi:hypothetical protein [Acanthopleuribacter pedis]|uniref:Pectate lyase C n=1 Tax=Acanthopleuribacter pedis TaxID=442870 RepID=A0A8J7Q3R4_9BACT|nr:hypothetical protein [Acanthopleuribacter pedis]MBO1317101.1 hypothetical protein [Acanthopleuribacter pedis]